MSSIPSGQLNEDILKSRLPAEEAAHGPAILGDEFVDSFARVGAGFDKDVELEPTFGKWLMSHTLHMIEARKGTGEHLLISATTLPAALMPATRDWGVSSALISPLSMMITRSQVISTSLRM